jgi:hypothetical protein
MSVHRRICSEGEPATLSHHAPREQLSGYVDDTNTISVTQMAAESHSGLHQTLRFCSATANFRSDCGVAQPSARRIAGLAPPPVVAEERDIEWQSGELAEGRGKARCGHPLEFWIVKLCLPPTQLLAAGRFNHYLNPKASVRWRPSALLVLQTCTVRFSLSRNG